MRIRDIPAAASRIRRIAITLNTSIERRACIGVGPWLLAAAGDAGADVEGGVGRVCFVAVEDYG